MPERAWLTRSQAFLYLFKVSAGPSSTSHYLVQFAKYGT
jgi:hypothetical protein